MKWHCRETTHLVFVDKPEGHSTHAVDTGRPGLVELWENHLGIPLWVCHRLDKGTSGAMVFAKSREAADRMRQIFSERKAGKSYWFLTDKSSTESEYLVRSEINKQGKYFVNDPESLTPNAVTQFTRIKRSPFFELWQARPETGKPHQIRLHARQLGLPILGDVLYGGTAFARLCLHACELEIPGEEKWSCPPPRLFERLGLLKDAEISAALTFIDRRQRLFNFLNIPEACLRLIEFESEALQLDLLGSQLWLSWFRKSDPTPRDLERWAALSRILKKPLLIQKRLNRGEQPAGAPKWRDEDFLPQWTGVEDGVRYQFQADSGESYGLFLDQRKNRARLAHMAPGKTLLNLFCYTSGFSLAAARAGARLTSSVDLSKAAIAWSQRNFELNPTPDTENEFFAADVFFFLDRAQKKGRQWDLIVCDPPIFSRGERVFRIEKDLIDLLQRCRAVLAPGGCLFFSTHYEAWEDADIEKILRRNFKGIQIELGEVDADVPRPPCSLKSFFLRF